MMEEFNRYRQDYDTLTFSDLKTIHSRWHKMYPNQKRFNENFFSTGLNNVINEEGESIKVIELGGHNGQLALESLKRWPKISWLNVEIVNRGTIEGLKDRNYKAHILSDQIWKELSDIKDYDVFVSSHVIEHLMNRQLETLINWLIKNQTKHILLDTPIKAEGQTWSDYFGAHLLEMGSNQVKGLLAGTYELIKEEKGWRSSWRRRE